MVTKDSKEPIYKIGGLPYDKDFAEFTLEKHGIRFDVSEIALSLPLYPAYSKRYKRSFSKKRTKSKMMMIWTRTTETIQMSRNSRQKGQMKPFTATGLQN